MMTFERSAMALISSAPPFYSGVRAPISPVCGDEVTHLRINLVAPAPAVEDAVMADLGLQEVMFLAVRQAAAEIDRRRGLADGSDVVVLAFDGEQGGPLDRRRIDLAAARHE